MQKQLKKLACIIGIFSFLCISPCSLAINNQPDLKQDEQIEYPNETGVEELVQVKDLDIEPINTQSLRKDVVPNPKSEGKKVIGLFLKTMLAVAFSAIILYLVLYFVKKFYKSAFVQNETNNEVESLDLSTPSSKQDALKSFLNRTK